MTSIVDPVHQLQLPNDTYKKLEFKNLIKDKVLKPSKLPRFDAVRAHHSHLVIRDSHYLIKEPTSFITCASCHRGRVLKISAIKELTTENILAEIYSTIGKNPCQKRKNTSKENQLLPTNQRLESQQRRSTHQIQQHYNTLPVSYPSVYQQPAITTAYPLPPTLPQLQQHGEIPTFEDLFMDFEPLQHLPQFAESMTINSVGTSIKVTSFTLASLFNAQSNFPANLDCFLSLAVEHSFGFFNNHTLVVPLPSYACTMFIKDPETNVSYFRTDENLIRTLNTRIHDFVQQKQLDLANLKVIIYFNYFQEGLPERPQESQASKYVGNVYILARFQAMADSSLNFTNLRYTFNHNYTWVDSTEELAKNKLFNELVISRLQHEVFLKTNDVTLGTHVDPLTLEKPALMTVVPFTGEEPVVTSAASSLFVVCYISLKLLRVVLGDDGLQMLGYLSTVYYNSKFHIYLLRLVVEQLRHEEKSFRPLTF